MKLNPTSFLGAPASLAASLGQLDATYVHNSIAALHHDIESRSLAAIDEQYSHFEVSSSWTSPDREGPPQILRQYFGAGPFNELALIEPRFAVLYIAALICKNYRFRGLQDADIANMSQPSNPDLLDICRWYAPADANRLVDAVKNYVEERAGQQVRLRNDWTRAKMDFFPAMADESTVLGRVNGQGLPQKIPPDRIPYLTFRDRTNLEGRREVIAVFEDGSGDILTNIKIRRAPSQTPPTPRSDAPAVSAYAETRTSMAGRPSAKELVLAVLAERIAANTICETLTAEAKALQPIVASRLRPEDAKPKVQSIQNMIREDYRKANAGKGTP
jgi:hypothetical protein